jgi:type I restriction enzyme S subunit
MEEAKRPLPEGWRWVRLGEVCEINPRRPELARKDDCLTTFVPMSAVDERLGAIVRAETKPFGQVKKGYTYFEAGDVLFAKITPCMQNGKHAIARDLVGGFGFGTTEFHVLHPGPAIIPDWTHHFIRQPEVLENAKAYFTGAVGQQRVPESYLADLEIPLPPLEAQKRIAAILNEQMGAVERARAAAEAQLEAAKALPAAYLRAVFSSPGAQQWPKSRIGEVAKLQSGYAFRSEWFSAEGIRLLRNANVSQGFIDWTEEVRLPWDRRSEFTAFELLKGDVILSLDRPVVSEGLKVARLTNRDVPSLLLQRVGRFQLGASISPEYIYAFLNTREFTHAITRHDQSIGVPHVSPLQVEEVELPLPPLSEQQRIAAMLNERMASAERARKAIGQELDAINKLPAALLRRAFAGDL